MDVRKSECTTELSSFKEMRVVTIYNTVKSWKSQEEKFNSNNFCHFIKFFKSTTEESV